MQLSGAPAQLVLPWANGDSGKTNPIPVPSQIGVTPGAASWTDGFPPLTRTAVTSGGIPPSGEDMNGGLFQMSGVDVWMSAGAGFPYSSAFSTAVGGYPKGARVLKATGVGYWLSTADNNTTDPDTGGAGWVTEGIGSIPSASVYASATQTLATGNAKILFDTVEFDPYSIWNAANKRFVAPWAGKYKVSGAVYLAAPGGQNLATQIWKNGALAKICFQAPQVSNVDLSLPFSGVISLAVSDYLEAYLNVTQSNVTAGLSGNGEASVYAQIEYMG